jgi:hypothetical protein
MILAHTLSLAGCSRIRIHSEVTQLLSVYYIHLRPTEIPSAFPEAYMMAKVPILRQGFSEIEIMKFLTYITHP